MQAIDDATPDDWGIEEADLEPVPAEGDAALEVTADDTETRADQDAEQPPAAAQASDTPAPTIDPESTETVEDGTADLTPEPTEEGAQADS